MDVGEFIEMLQCGDDCPIVVKIDGKIRHINHVIIASIPEASQAAIIIPEDDDE